jgi:hypothetical protein
VLQRVAVPVLVLVVSCLVGALLAAALVVYLYEFVRGNAGVHDGGVDAIVAPLRLVS